MQKKKKKENPRRQRLFGLLPDIMEPEEECPSFDNMTVNTMNLTPVCNNNRKVSAGVIGQTITYRPFDPPPHCQN